MSETAEKYGNGAEKRPLTAVEWLEDVYNTQGRILPQQFEQAKEREKEQHKETFKQSRQAKIFEKDMPPVWESWEQYYNQSYGKP